MRVAELILRPHYEVIPTHWTEGIIETIQEARPDIGMVPKDRRA
jgi:hypothetical protein